MHCDDFKGDYHSYKIVCNWLFIIDGIQETGDAYDPLRHKVVVRKPANYCHGIEELKWIEVK
jgi:hypothetical protein